MDRLNGGLSPANPLILVSAPAGYGKTSLVIDWIYQQLDDPAGHATRFAWFSLEDSDNAPGRFYSYLIASLQKALPGVELGAADWMEACEAAPQAPAAQTLVASLVNDLARLDFPICLVLDDYHVLRSAQIHAAVASLIEHAPPNFHLVLTTRSDPPFPLHRYRAGGHMLELRLADLRFAAAEISAFLQQTFRLDLEREVVQILAQRTEGWIAGLQMAGLSLNGKPDAAGYIRSLSGAQRYILDYLAEEVLQGQPRPVQQFLLATSILDRLSGPLCDALLGAGFFPGGIGLDAGAVFEDSQAMLDFLERANLFLIPLDDERRWYRYHPLFADLLRIRLKQARPLQAGSEQALHRRAAGWFEQAGLVEAAIEHFLQAQDYDRAAELVERSTLELFARGALQALVDWAPRLPAHLAAQRPWLSIHQAWAMAFVGKLAEVAPRLAQARRAIETEPSASGELAALQAEMTAIQALVDLQASNLAAVLALEHLPAEAIPPGSLFARSVIRWALGFAWRIQGRLAEARVAFEEVVQIGLQIDNLWTITTGTVDLGTVQRLAGQLDQAERTYREGLRRAQQAGAGGLGFLGRLESFLAATLYEKDALDEALELAQRSVVHNQLWDNPNHVVHAYWVLARIYAAQGDLGGAAQVLDHAKSVIAAAAVLPALVVGVEGLRLRLGLLRGRLAEATDWLAAHPAPGTARDETGRSVMLISARARLALGDAQGACRLVDDLEREARRSGLVNSLIETLVLKALRLAALDPTGLAEACQALGEALALGLPVGYQRVFLDEGRPMRRLVEAFRAHPVDLPAHLQPGLDRLLAVFPAEDDPPAEGAAAETQAVAGMPFGLTGREVEILGWMAQGLTNAEIGQRLYISTGTVKAHSAAIYRKLQAANRTEAIGRAKDLGIV